jgi:uncharacterized protein with GYD domain
MPTYISLLNFTDKGVREVRQTLDRARAAAELADKMGGDLKEIYWTVGSYDVVTVAEFPDEETMAAFVLEIGSLGNVRSTTLLAFDRHEIASVLQKFV